MPRVKQYIAGHDGWSEWIIPVMRGYRLICCDCGLSHTMEFKTLRVVKHLSALVFNHVAGKGHRVKFRVRLNKRSTAAVRREERKSQARTASQMKMEKK